MHFINAQHEPINPFTANAYDILNGEDGRDNRKNDDNNMHKDEDVFERLFDETPKRHASQNDNAEKTLPAH